jgi:tetratricopeptide (TPR) repeat protein
MVKKMVKYNPAFLSADELVEAFVVRHAELGLIVEVVRENVGESNQHVLVIGPRGIGKTMLVLRVAEEVRRAEDLKGRWYPLVFSEESYQVTSPGEFWLEALFHLGQQTKEDRWKKTYEELKREGDETRLRERALAQLMDFADEVGRRIMLVVENFNMLAGALISDDDAWVLRHTLQNEPRVMLLATATSRFEEVENSGKAMFDLFRPMELEPLGTKDCGRLWHAITGEAASDKRVAPLKILTGGSPRLMQIASEFAGRMSLKALIDDLMQLVDENTEYFKSQLDHLPATERKVYLALAEIWDPATAKEVAKAARVGVSKASSLLGRLVERGAVVTADGEGRKKRYQVAERMYNIYYLMRRRGAPSRRVKAVVNFMVSFYGQEELATMAARIAEEACGLAAEMRIDHYCAYEGILKRASRLGVGDALLEATPKVFFDMPDIPGSIKRLVKPEEKEEDMVDLLGKVIDAWESGKTAGEIEELCRKAIEIAPERAEPWTVLGLFLEEKPGRYEEAEEAHRKSITLNKKYARGWGYLGSLLHQKLGRYDEAEEAYRKAIEVDERYAWAWAHLGLLLHEKLERYDEAEEAYRKAIELDEKYVWAWANLGQLLEEKLERYDEAEEAYRKAIELEPDETLGHAMFARLLLKVERYDEAEEALRKTVELEPENGYGRFALGGILCVVGKTEGALEQWGKYLEDTAAVEKAVDRAIDLGIELAARGVGRQTLKVLEGSASAGVLEPLIVGLRMYLGEDVRVAAEIMEIGKDVAKRIEERRGEGD